MEDNFRENLKNIKKIVIKVGTKILLDENNKPNKNSIQRIVEGIWKIREDHKKEVVLVTSGAIGIGMGVLGKKERPRSIPQKQAAAAVGQNKLMHLYETEFSKKNLHVGQVLITAEDLNNKMRYLNIKNTLACLLEMKIIPIINENDSVAVDEIKVGDNDTLSALVTLLIGAELLILLTDCEGLFRDDPKKFKDAQRISIVSAIDRSIEKMAGKAGSEVSTGGMKTKISAARMVTTAGRFMIIADGRQNLLEDIVLGKDVGTLFLPKHSLLSSRKSWIAFGTKKKGAIVLDAGAVRAIVESGKSLLAAGITHVKGNFSAGDIVGLFDEKGQEIASGLSNYCSEDLEKIKGIQSQKIEQILGHCDFEEAIHRDNLVML